MTHLVVLPTIAAFSLALSGCGAPSDSEATPGRGSSAPAVGHKEHSDADHHEHADHEHGAPAGGPMEQMKASLAELSPADAASAERQHFCPVSGEMLGTMGPPEKVEVEGREVWICCDSCRERLLADPAPYLAKLTNE